MSPAETPIAIYCPRRSPRLDYVLQIIFTERLQTSYALFSSIEEWGAAPGKKINYTREQLPECLHILPAPLLFEENIQPQQIELNRWKKTFIVFYNQPGATIPFDIFSATFFMLSRYEEYLEFTPDQHGRFPAKSSLAGRYNFLHQPVVDIWIQHLAAILDLSFTPKVRLEITADIDLMWKYHHKSKWRRYAGILRDILSLERAKLRERSQVSQGKKRDPFDAFEWMEQQAQGPIRYFVLCGGQTALDRNTASDHTAFQKKIQDLAKTNELSIHPSYSAQTAESILAEKNKLESIIKRTINHSRQHYIRLKLPDTYQALVEASITEDYTMGYPEANGFRAGTSHPFNWFDLSSNKTSSLRVHPFVYMDASSVFYLRQNEQEELRQIEQLARTIKQNGGVFCGIWHNYLIGDELQYPGRKQRYVQTLSLLREILGTST